MERINKYVLYFLLLTFIQHFVLNNIYIFDIFHPFIYVYLIIILPVNYKGWVVLVLAFFLGLFNDIFMHTIGIQAASLVGASYFRLLFINRLYKKEKVTHEPHIFYLGWKNYLMYVSILVFIHHFILFSLDSFSFHHYFYTLFKIFVNSVVSFSLIILLEVIIFFRK